MTFKITEYIHTIKINFKVVCLFNVYKRLFFYFCHVINVIFFLMLISTFYICADNGETGRRHFDCDRTATTPAWCPSMSPVVDGAQQGHRLRSGRERTATGRRLLPIGGSRSIRRRFSSQQVRCYLEPCHLLIAVRETPFSCLLQRSRLRAAPTRLPVSWRHVPPDRKWRLSVAQYIRNRKFVDAEWTAWFRVGRGASGSDRRSINPTPAL